MTRPSTKFCLEDKTVTYRIDTSVHHIYKINEDNSEIPVSNISFKIIEEGDRDPQDHEEGTQIKYILFSDYEIKLYIKN